MQPPAESKGRAHGMALGSPKPKAFVHFYTKRAESLKVKDFDETIRSTITSFRLFTIIANEVDRTISDKV